METVCIPLLSAIDLACGIRGSISTSFFSMSRPLSELRYSKVIEIICLTYLQRHRHHKCANECLFQHYIIKPKTLTSH